MKVLSNLDISPASGGLEPPYAMSMEDQKVMYMDERESVVDLGKRAGGRFESTRNCKHLELTHIKENIYECQKCNKRLKVVEDEDK